ILVDKSKNLTDVPHDYLELATPIKTRYLRLENIHVPEGKFAISGFRVFGLGNGQKPEKVKGFVVLRTENDKRSAWLKWYPSADAWAYNIYLGTEPDKLYNSVMVLTANDYWLKTMDREKSYFFAIEAINENGTSEWVGPIEVK
ncbi:MAG TPA: 1,4-beta-xylanase, partial [Prolixibacteraceae bacterium]|nr:1,4-beta-xylanase [Prolixibacteraceae bacterium]